jgi:hypothetical protein
MSDQNVTVTIDKDEWYPVYTIVEDGSTYGFPLTIPATLAERTKAATDEFNAVQDELHRIAKVRQP